MKTILNGNAIQIFDKSIDREYYKVCNGIFGAYDVLVRSDRIENKTVCYITGERLPDEIYFNGEKCKIVLTKPKKINKPLK